MSRYSVFVLIVLFFAPAPLAAQEQSHIDAIEELMQITNADQTTQLLREAMRLQISGMSGQFGFSEKQKGFFDKYMEKVMALVYEDLSWENMKPDMIKLYADIFTEEETLGLIDFYRSPIGQKAIAKMPEIIRYSTELGQKRLAVVMPKIQALMEEMKKEMAQKESE